MQYISKFAIWKYSERKENYLSRRALTQTDKYTQVHRPLEILYNPSP